MTVQVKICGIKDPDIAYRSAQLGADWIGVVLIPESRRFVNVNQAREICHAAKEGGAKTVAVVYQINPGISEQIPLDGLQLYSPSIPNKYTNFYVNHCPLINKDGYLLLDNMQGGSGLELDPDTIIPTPSWKWFLAGGLNPSNVRRYVMRFHPDGVDVSSGVEKEGQKNLDLIKAFINEVKCG